MDLNLLEKTEIWFDNLVLSGANLTELAAAVARVLELPTQAVLVVDVREDHVTLDVLQKVVRAEQFMGKRDELLRALSAIQGVTVTDRTEVHSDGILGMIGLDRDEVPAALERTRGMTDDVRARVSRRALVVPTGFEVQRGMIVDTNSPFIRSVLSSRGYSVKVAPAQPDDADVLAGVLRLAVSEGFGLVVTTGGVGAEDKDYSVEAVLQVAPDASTPYTVHFQKGTGRHVKDGVRIAVGSSGVCRFVALPGPNDEVQAALPVLVDCLGRGDDDADTAEAIAAVLREKLRDRKSWHHHDAAQAGASHSDKEST